MMLKPQLYIYLLHALRRVFLNPFIKELNFLITKRIIEIIVASTYLEDSNQDLE